MKSASGKFWVLMANGKLLNFHRYTLIGDYTETSNQINSLDKAQKAATEYVKKNGGDVYIMEAVAFATVPITVVKIE